LCWSGRGILFQAPEILMSCITGLQIVSMLIFLSNTWNLQRVGSKAYEVMQMRFEHAARRLETRRRRMADRLQIAGPKVMVEEADQTLNLQHVDRAMVLAWGWGAQAARGLDNDLLGCEWSHQMDPIYCGSGLH
jgi:hypothetical protein